MEMRKGLILMRAALSALVAVVLASCTAWAGPASTYTALDGATLYTLDDSGHEVICRFYGLDDAALVGLLVNEYHGTDGDFEAVTKQDFLSWHIRHDGIIVIAGAHCFVRSESVLHRLESCDAQKLTPGEER